MDGTKEFREVGGRKVIFFFKNRQFKVLAVIAFYILTDILDNIVGRKVFYGYRIMTGTFLRIDEGEGLFNSGV